MRSIIQGDFTTLQFDPHYIHIIPQICNNVGKYGAGLSGALASRWPQIRDSYFEWHGGQGKNVSGDFVLGEMQTVRVEKHVMIINMIAQNNVRGPYNPNPIDYCSLEKCLIRIFGTLCQLTSKYPDGYFHLWFAKIGSGLAGGDWGKIQSSIDHWFDHPEYTLTYVQL